MGELSTRIKQKYPQYANIPDDQLEQKIVAKYPQYAKLQTPQQGNWLTGNAQDFGGKALNTIGNILNLPSYALGGVMKGRTQALQQGNINPGLFSDIRSAVQGVKEKTPVMQELPKMYGVDPESLGGQALGFGGELLTPNIPFLGLFGKGAKTANIASDVAKTSKIGEIGKDLLLKSYKFSQSDIKKLAESLGATDPSTYKDIVVDFLQKQKLTGGATQQGMESVVQAIKPVQESFNALAKTGGQVSRKPLIQELLNAAIKAEEADTPQSRILAKKLLDEAVYQESKAGKALTDTQLTKRITQLFSEAGESAVGDPFSSSLSKQIAKAGQSARETLRPGTTALGRELKGLRTAQEVIGRTANVGKGTQLINSFKPFVPGATSGYILSGGNLPATIAGAIGATIGNNPANLNKIARATLSFAGRTGKSQAEKALKTGLEATKKLFGTGARVATQEKPKSNPKQSSVVRESSSSIIQPIEKKQKIVPRLPKLR